MKRTYACLGYNDIVYKKVNRIYKLADADFSIKYIGTVYTKLIRIFV